MTDFPFRRILLALTAVLLLVAASAPAAGPRKMENLGRGVVAVRKSEKEAFISWRLLALDPADIKFNLYRSTGGGAPVKLNDSPLGKGTNYVDGSADLTKPNAYTVRPVLGGVEKEPSAPWILAANAEIGPLFRVPLRTPPDRRVHNVWVGDLDGDGEYEFVVQWIGAVSGQTQKLQTYKRDGTFLWEVDLGKNSVDSDNIYVSSATIAAGQWDGVTVYDLDSDGRAEVILKSADGVTFGDGKTLKEADDLKQFISVLDGMTGAERARAELPNPWKRRIKRPLGTLFGIGYLDGVQPSLFIHAKNRNESKSFNQIESAWDFRDGKLTQRWSKEQDGDRPGGEPEGHQIRIVDVDGDGRDEILPGMHALTPDGKLLYSLGDSGMVHGDRFHVSDLDPKRPGLEGYGIQQNNAKGIAEYFYDAKTGKILWENNVGKIVDAARGSAVDIDPRHPGFEVWSFYGIRTAQGEKIADDPKRPYPNLTIWWDGDLLGENLNEVRLEKWNYEAQNTSRLLTTSKFGAQANGRRVPPLYGDILGDWREEIVYANYKQTELLVFTTDIPTDFRLYTLAQNPAYRNCLTVKGYVQENLPDYFLGDGMATPPTPNIVYVTPATAAAGVFGTVAAAASPAPNATPTPNATPAPNSKAAPTTPTARANTTPDPGFAAGQERVKAILERRRAEQARWNIDFKGRPRALLIVRDQHGKMDFVRASAVNEVGNVVAAEVPESGKALWQKAFVLRQLPWPTEAELGGGKVAAGEKVLATYQEAAAQFPAFQSEFAAETEIVKSGLATAREREAKMTARYTAIVSRKYDPETDYTTEDLEAVITEAELATADFPDKSEEIEKAVAPFRDHLEKLTNGYQRVNGVWRTAKEAEFDAFIQRLGDHRLAAVVLTRAQWLAAATVPLAIIGALLLVSLGMAARKRSRSHGGFLLLLTIGGTALCVYGLTTGARPPRATSDADSDGAMKIAGTLYGLPSTGEAAADATANPLTFTTGDLNQFASRFLKIAPPPADAGGDLQRTALSVVLARDRVLFFEHVRLFGLPGTISYNLAPNPDAPDGLKVDSASLGEFPVPASLAARLWQGVTGEIGKALSPGAETLQLDRVENGVIEVSRRPTTPTP